MRSTDSWSFVSSAAPSPRSDLPPRTRARNRPVALFALLIALAGCSPQEETAPPLEPWTLTVTPVGSGTEALLQAIAPVDESVVWVSGHRATWARSEDGGAEWTVGTVPGDETLQFRDVAAFDASTAYLMAAGEGDRSRIYRTDDGGGSWTLQYTADDPAAFLDCMDFWSPDRGLVYGDAIDGVPFILVTEDGGATWSRVPDSGLPPALEGEGGFAASGTCLEVGDAGEAWIATGNGERPRILTTRDFGATWSASDIPVVGGAASGLATVRLGAGAFGVALGGVIGSDTVRSENVVVTFDRGGSWSSAGPLSMAGPVYGSAIAAEAGSDAVVVAVGPRGLDWSSDSGASWVTADTLTYWAVDFASARAGWATGPSGRIARLSVTGGGPGE